MKIKKSWIAVALILIVGIWITHSTRQYVSMTELQTAETYAAGRDTWEAETAPETAAVPGALMAEAGAGSGEASGQGSSPRNSAAGEAGGLTSGENRRQDTDTAMATDGSTVFEGAAAGSGAVRAGGIAASDASAAAGGSKSVGSAAGAGKADADKAEPAMAVAGALNAPAADSSQEKLAADATVRLKELDEQIEKSHQSGQDTTTNSLKATAESERKLWEAELKQILDTLEDELPDDEKEALFQEQKLWIQDREKQAVDDSKKQSGSALEELEYNISLRDSTRLRAYELAERYAEILSAER